MPAPTPALTSDLPDLIRRILDRDGIDQKTLAAGLQVCEATISYWRAGERKPNREHRDLLLALDAEQGGER